MRRPTSSTCGDLSACRKISTEGFANLESERDKLSILVSFVEISDSLAFSGLLIGRAVQKVTAWLLIVKKNDE